MKITWQSEVRNYVDPRSGCSMRQLTNHKAHSHHLYFTNPGWFDSGRRLLFGGDRVGRTNLFSIELESGEITQHTDSDIKNGSYQTTYLNPTRDEVYFWRDGDLMALDLATSAERQLYRCDAGFRSSVLSVTSDGSTICTSVYEDLSSRFRVDLGHGYLGFDNYWEARPLSRILSIPITGGAPRELLSERCWIGHVNTSPTQPNLLTYCHEGPWAKVDQRIWGMEIATGRIWPIRPRRIEGERVGHEYWWADGVHIGYHGSRPDGVRVLGRTLFDNTDAHEAFFPHHTQHIHSNNIDYIVGDGSGGDGRLIKLWRWNGLEYEGPRTLCEHGSSAFHQLVHVHPRFSPDGSRVIFTSDRSGYGQVYEAQVPDFQSLPLLA